jgi:zinc transporter 1/2/3
MHDQTQFCFAGDAEYEVLTTASATGELPSQYTGCHSHGADLYDTPNVVSRSID